MSADEVPFRGVGQRALGRARRTLNGARRRLGTTSAQHAFATRAPSAQQAIDLFAGQWITAFPQELGLNAGWVNHFDPQVDTRVPWACGVIPGGVAGRTVLELGPFEGYHSAALEQAGAATVVAVEASSTAYLKCLVVKEVLGLNARYLYGDVPAFLAQSDEQFDVVWASGILYHQAEPITFLELAARHGDHLFLHTHYWDAARCAQIGTADRFDPARDVTVDWHGRSIRLHHYNSGSDTTTGTFAGGPRPFARWMSKDDLEFVLRELGLTQITYGVDDPANPAGPGCFLVASRP